MNLVLYDCLVKDGIDFLCKLDFKDTLGAPVALDVTADGGLPLSLTFVRENRLAKFPYFMNYINRSHFGTYSRYVFLQGNKIVLKLPLGHTLQSELPQCTGTDPLPLSVHHTQLGSWV